MGPLHMTFPLSSWQEMVSVPWVLIKPSSQTTEMELPSWKLSPKRRALMGMPGSGHSLWPNAAVKGYKETQIWWGRYRRHIHKKSYRGVWDRALTGDILLIILITFLRTNLMDIWLQRDTFECSSLDGKMSINFPCNLSILYSCCAFLYLCSYAPFLCYSICAWVGSKQCNFSSSGQIRWWKDLKTANTITKNNFKKSDIHRMVWAEIPLQGQMFAWTEHFNI